MIIRQQKCKEGSEYLSFDMVQKRPLEALYPGCSYDEILKTVKLPTLSARKTDSSQRYFNESMQSKHKLNNLLADVKDVPYSSIF